MVGRKYLTATVGEIRTCFFPLVARYSDANPSVSEGILNNNNERGKTAARLVGQSPAATTTTSSTTENGPPAVPELSALFVVGLLQPFSTHRTNRGSPLFFRSLHTQGVNPLDSNNDVDAATAADFRRTADPFTQPSATQRYPHTRAHESAPRIFPNATANERQQ
ncbi:hypothetical protein QTP88_013955 [Uroleucon formosanum]